jgi:N-acetylneuraminic acid mutarotase
MGVVGELLEGFVVLGGIDKNNEVVEDCWYCDNEKQTFSRVPLEIAYGDLRGAKGCSLEGQMIYVMGGNSQNFKALQIIPEK